MVRQQPDKRENNWRVIREALRRSIWKKDAPSGQLRTEGARDRADADFLMKREFPEIYARFKRRVRWWWRGLSTKELKDQLKDIGAEEGLNNQNEDA